MQRSIKCIIESLRFLFFKPLSKIGANALRMSKTKVCEGSDGRCSYIFAGVFFSAFLLFLLRCIYDLLWSTWIDIILFRFTSSFLSPFLFLCQTISRIDIAILCSSLRTLSFLLRHINGAII